MFTSQHIFTKLEAARYLRLSRRTIDGLISRRELRPAPVGKRVLFMHAELDAFLARAHGGSVDAVRSVLRARAVR
jgi:excisionase family DNA binding protein